MEMYARPKEMESATPLRIAPSMISRVYEPLVSTFPLKCVLASKAVSRRSWPNGSYSGMGSPDNVKMPTYIFEKINHYDLAYLAILDGFGFGYHGQDRLLTAFDAKTHFKGNVLTNGSYTRDIIEGAIRSGVADSISFGRAYISMPDLPEHFEHHLPLNPEAPYSVY